MTAVESIPCTEKDVDALCEQVNRDEEDGEVSSGMGFEYSDGLYIFAEEFGSPEELSETARKMIGALLKKAGKSFIQIGFAEYCDKLREDSAGGGAVRIYANGSVKYAKLVWK
jgi:hypothetical protein